MPAPGRTVVVWGNCQAEPMARLLQEPLRRHGLEVVEVPPVFLIDEPGLGRVRNIVATSAYLISQPVRDDYRVAGCGVGQLSELLPTTGRLITFPVAFHVGAFPYLVNGHGGDGQRINAPGTDYHDLRAVAAAHRALTLSQALAWWPEPTADAVEEINARSVEEMRQREKCLDVGVSDYLDEPNAMWTISHPTNNFLAAVARSLLDVMSVVDDVATPEREFLGARRAPLETAVAEAHGWPPGAVTREWIIDGRSTPLTRILGEQLDFYRSRPDVVADCLIRYAERLDLLSLG